MVDVFILDLVDVFILDLVDVFVFDLKVDVFILDMVDVFILDLVQDWQVLHFYWYKKLPEGSLLPDTWCHPGTSGEDHRVRIFIHRSCHKVKEQ